MYEGRIHVVLFEDLLENLEDTLIDILKFLNLPVDEADNILLQKNFPIPYPFPCRI